MNFLSPASRKNLIMLLYFVIAVLGRFIVKFYGTDIYLFTSTQALAVAGVGLGINLLARGAQYAKFRAAAAKKDLAIEYLTIMEKLREIFMASPGFHFVIAGVLLTCLLYYFRSSLIGFAELLQALIIFKAGYDALNVVNKKPKEAI
jgi:hypothetical protein